MSWSLAGNLGCRHDHILAEFPGTTIWAIGDQDHKNSESDHNEDARSIVHAIDAMTYTDTDKGDAIVEWCLRDTTDLEYIIFNGSIWSRSNKFARRDYTGSNDHSDHVHISGRHGDTGWAPATGTGYSTDAEKYRPEGFDDVTPDQVKQAVIDALNTKIEWVSNGVHAYADSIGNGDPISTRMAIEHMWARAVIDNVPMSSPSPIQVQLDQMQSTLDGLAVAVAGGGETA